ncbi:MAG: hypothetical protein ACI4TM_03785 [Candidatus Cryptobacteroides sp.]
MSENSPLFSDYVIDGIPCNATPAELIEECMPSLQGKSYAKNGVEIVDELLDPPPTSFVYESENPVGYADAVMEAAKFERPFRMLYPETFTRERICASLITSIWREGHFRLDNLEVDLLWKWQTTKLGNMASFYNSAASASDYLYSLGVRISGYHFEETCGNCVLRVSAALPPKPSGEGRAEEELLLEMPFESTRPWMGEGLKCPSKAAPDNSSWLIYIPFDTCGYKLGGSLLAEVSGHNGGVGPVIGDPDYFIDCYEIVREFVEDGIVMAGVTVCDGGLMAALASLCADCAVSADINGIATAYNDTDATKILYSEVPGVLFQIHDADYDYVDAQLLLQDVAYYPIGHPDHSRKGISVVRESRAGVASILASLMQGQMSEGED